jgi:hypothetical protein
MNQKASKRSLLAGFLLVFGLLFTLDWFTLCPDLYWFDSAEFVNDAYLLDIPHPPGYPLFNLLAHLFLKIPAGSLGARVNLFSATCGSLAAGVYFLFLSAAGIPLLMAFAGSLLLGVSSQFWELSVVTEVYSLEALLLSIALWRLARNSTLMGTQEPTEKGADGILALAMGLALFHRPTVLFFLAPWFLLLYPRLAHPVRFLALMACGSLPYLHTAWVFFLKTAPPGQLWSINYFDFPRTFETFLRICSGTLYASNFGILPPPELAREIHGYVSLARDQFGVCLVALGALGLLRTPRRQSDRLDLFLAVLFLGNVVFFLHYNALEKDTMYVPSFLALLALSLRTLARLLGGLPDPVSGNTALVVPPPRHPQVLALAAGCVLLIWTGLVAAHNRPEVDKHDYFTVKKCVDNTARLVAPGSYLYLTDDLIIHPFFFARITRNLRPDVSLRIVDGFGKEVESGLDACLRAKRTVYSPLFYPEEVYQVVKKRYRMIPRGFLYEIWPQDGPLPQLPPQKGTPTRFGAISLLGSGIYPHKPRVESSDQVQVVMTWEGPVADTAVIFRWRRTQGPPVTWVFRIGYQGRSSKGSSLTEEYLLTIPRKLGSKRDDPGWLEVTVQPGVAQALQYGHLREVSSRKWREHEAFFKGREGAFVECMERGWPAFFPVLEPGPVAAGLAGPWIELGTMTLKGLEEQ